MTDLEVLKRHGYSQEVLKNKFEDKEKPDALKKWVERTARRIDEGIKQRMDKSRFYYAIDRAYEVSQRQVTFTLVEGLISGNPSSDQVLNAAKSWGIEGMMVDVLGPGGVPVCGPNGQCLKTLDLPTFYQIFVPLVSAYTKIRWAKLFQDRDLWPHYKYDPLKLTLKNKAKADIITDRIQRMSVEMGYRDDEKQSILQMLLYGECLNLPREEWFKEEQIVMDGDKENTITVREGIRWAIPHPTRYFYDLAHRASTLNSDTGCEYSGYWDLVRYSGIKDDPLYWNREEITFGRGKWYSGDAWNLYSMFYPCVAKFPTLSNNRPGAGASDRVEEAFRYSADENDSSVTVVNYFEKVIPSKIGLFDYDHPVWMRFVVAGDETIVFSAPLAFTPNVNYQYDPDQSRAFNTSLALELLPWQDHFGNYLTQKLLSVKQNLDQVVFWNAQILKQADVDQIQNRGQKRYSGRTYIPLKPRELAFAQTSTDSAFWPVNFPLLPTQEVDSAIRMMLEVMERMLGFSSQEIGSSASHEESATEVNIKHQNTSIRLDFTGQGVDTAREARKRSLYDAMMAYSTDEIFAEVGEMNDATKAALKEMGFEVEEEASGTQTKAGVKGSKKGLLIDGFASGRDGAARITDSKVVATMIQTFQSIFSNPVIVERYGVETLVEMFNQILTYAGMPRDYRLKIDPKQEAKAKKEQGEQQKQQQDQLLAGLQEQMTAIAVQVSGQVVEKGLGEMAGAVKQLVEQSTQPIVAATAANSQAIQQQQQHDAMADELIAKLAAIVTASQTIPAPPPNPPTAYDSVGAIPIAGVTAPAGFPMVTP